MAQQVFNQWAPVAKAQNEQGQEVYLPFAGIYAQTRDGNDELIVGAGNMVWTGSMWVPVSMQNRLPVDAAVSGTVDVSDRADRQLGKVALTGQIVEYYNGAEVVRTKEIGKAYRTHFFMDSEYVEVAAGAFVDDSEILSVNGFSTLAVLLRVQSTSRDIRVRARWYSGNTEPFAAGSAYEDLLEGSMQTGVATTDTKSPFVRLRIHNNSQTPDQFHLGVLLR